MSYVIQQGFSRAATGPGNANIANGGLGVGILLPALPDGSQIDGVYGRADSSVAASTIPSVRVTLFRGAINPAGLVSLVTALPATFGQYNAIGAPTDPLILSVLAETVAGGLTVGLDLVIVVGQLMGLTFSSRPGGGLIIPPGESGILLLTPLTFNGGGSPATQPYCSLTVIGGPLAAGQAANGSAATAGDASWSTPARFGNVQVPPASR